MKQSKKLSIITRCFSFRIGSIFGIWKKPEGVEEPIDCILQSGEHLRCAGYAVYGSACALVLATQDSVNGYTLDPVRTRSIIILSSVFFILVHRRIHSNIAEYANATMGYERCSTNLQYQ